MAQEQSPTPTRAWTKIFTAFKIALDLKKLTLAAVGIFLAASGWWLFSVAFYNMRTFPEWKKIENVEKPDQKQAQWAHFKAKRASWNLLHELAGPPSDHKKVDAGDVTDDPEEYELLHKWEEGYQRLNEPLTWPREKVLKVTGINQEFTLTPVAADAESALLKLKDRSLTVGSIQFPPGPKDAEVAKIITIDGVAVKVEGAIEKLKEYRDGAWTPAQIAALAAMEKNQEVAQKALKTFNTHLIHAKIKPAGLLRMCPWSEDRGSNPYQVVADTVKTRDAAGANRDLLHWLFSDKVLVLLEPLVKFLMPVVYLFHKDAGGWDRLYLILIILWTLAVWGFFGGAICRIAAVQVARNERISLREAINFTKERFASFVAAPVFPMVLLLLFVIALMIFGWIEWIPWVGDVFAGLFWPVVILIGFIMAIVLVGLIGWPLMIATISTEGTDSFDALSRSYSYIYQAPWQYLWYNFLAVVYGAVLVFFVGFMASMMVFVGKWSVASAPGLADSRPTHDRDPAYLFYYAPTSYGWRDLLISSNTPHVETKKVVAPNGHEVDRVEFKAEYEKNISGWNAFGAALVAIWIYPLFLLMLGFSYSYFWTASTIIYFLMRKHVDDTEMDEVHQEDEDLDDPFMKATTAAPPPSAAAPASKPGTVSLSVVDAPPASPTTYTADDHHSSEPKSPPPSAPESNS